MTATQFKSFLIKIILLLVLLWGVNNAYGQNEKKSYLGLEYSFGNSNYNTLRYVVGSEDYEGKGFYGLRIEYGFFKSANTLFAVGLDATVNNMMHYSTYAHIGSAGTNEYDKVFDIYSIPFQVRHYLFKYLFLGGGPILNYHPSMGYKWGLGGEIKAGVEYSFKSNISVSAYPFGRWNLLGLFYSSDPNGETDLLSQKGLKIGVGYKF